MTQISRKPDKNAFHSLTNGYLNRLGTPRIRDGNDGGNDDRLKRKQNGAWRKSRMWRKGRETCFDTDIFLPRFFSV